MLALLLCLLLPAFAEEPPRTLEKSPPVESGQQLKWFRDSAEYWTLARQTYRVATTEVLAQARKQKKRSAWGVVLDVDETVLDNSAYQLERMAYGIPFDAPSWNAWVERRAAQAIPGAVDFVNAVRAAGGEIIYITNRDVSTTKATRENLVSTGLWKEGDTLCLADANNRAYDKVARRKEARAGSGGCSDGRPLSILGYVGDTLTDFPDQGEEPAEIQGVREAMFGTRYFLLPNPLYGSWETRVTRPM